MNKRELKRKYRAMQAANAARLTALEESYDARNRSDAAHIEYENSMRDFSEYIGSQKVVIGGRLYSVENGLLQTKPVTVVE